MFRTWANNLDSIPICNVHHNQVSVYILVNIIYEYVNVALYLMIFSSEYSCTNKINTNIH